MYTLIIVDDEDITRMAVSGYIGKLHPSYHVVNTFTNGESALQFLKQTPVDVVITDIKMPEMDGLELCQHIRELYPHIHIIIISSYGEFSYAQRAIQYGVSNYLMKPLDFDELSLSLNQIGQKLERMYAVMTDSREEDIELFFADLLHGSVRCFSELSERYKQLQLNIPFEDCHGFFSQITLEDDSLSQWNYNRENISIALQNGLRMFLPDYTTYHLFRTGRNYYFITLSSRKIPAFSPAGLCEMLYSLLHFGCRMQIMLEFDQLNSFLSSSEPVLEVKEPSSEQLCREEPHSAAAKNIMQKATEYIRSHYAQDLTREDVADYVYVSPSYFSKCFKQYTGMSFTDYLTTVRMEEAAALLKTHLKVGDIGIKVGYQSRNRFFINFRQYSGYSPSEYRRQILQMEDISDETEK